MTKDELLTIVRQLQISTQYFCDAGTHQGQFKVKVNSPYIHTDLWDRLLKELEVQPSDH